ncbi:METTL4 [Mytilus coruscus]|uniref:METTL4 n=1 Tax=Mytilus coruscus TaxID=42192 RepID=A0A6J8B404_MYTCO|nr:METTL4 [Mytilus coruscus]
MAIKNQNMYGWILDHWQLTADTFKDVYSEDGTVTDFSYKRNMFKINSQFIMDSEFESKIRVQERVDDTHVKRKKRKRKRKSDLNEGEIKAKTYHDKIIEVILHAYKSLLHGSKEMKLFNDIGKSLDNNVAARKIAMSSGPGDKLRELCYTDNNDLDIETVTLKPNGVYDNLCNKLVKNCSNSSIKVKIKDDFYFLPAESSFIMGDTVNLKYFATILGRNEFDFILLDPPWENKSVKRKKQYWTLDNEELFKIPVPELSAPGCVIGVWVTNKMKHKDFVIQELFPFWNVDFITTWYWIKVTKTGSTVLDIMSEHKKPYEILILGKCKHTEMKKISEEKIDSKTKEENKKNDICKNMKCKENSSERISSKSLDGMCYERTILPALLNNKDLPLEMTMMSVPSSVHSMKIPLQDIMKPYLPEKPKCLEIFARNLTPGWCCYGNEVFKHQHMDYFEGYTEDMRIPLDCNLK